MKEYLKKKQQHKEHIKQHVEWKLILRLKIFAVIVTGIILTWVWKIYLGELWILLGILALSIGILIGFLTGRMFKIFWHEETQKVISRLDAIGVGFLIIYIAIEVERTWFFGHWLTGVELNTFALIFVAGTLLGRLLSMIQSIKKVLKEEEKSMC